MATSFIDANVIIRYLVEEPETVPKKFKGVYSFFQKIEMGEIKIELTELVLFETFFVLTNLYKIPSKTVSATLAQLISFKGIELPNKKIITACLKILQKKSMDLVDAYLIALSKEKGIKGIYSFDKDLEKSGLRLLEVT